jgi:hypothetical protein
MHTKAGRRRRMRICSPSPIRALFHTLCRPFPPSACTRPPLTHERCALFSFMREPTHSTMHAPRRLGWPATSWHHLACTLHAASQLHQQFTYSISPTCFGSWKVFRPRSSCPRPRQEGWGSAGWGGWGGSAEAVGVRERLGRAACIRRCPPNRAEHAPPAGPRGRRGRARQLSFQTRKKASCPPGLKSGGGRWARMLPRGCRCQAHAR